MNRLYEMQDIQRKQSQTRPTSCVSIPAEQKPVEQMLVMAGLYLAISAKAFDTMTYRGGSSG